MTIPKKLNKKKIRSDPIYFIENIIGMKLTSFQKEWLRLVEDKQRVCFMAFRSSGKTRQLFVNYFVWKAVCNPAHQYLIISKTLPQAIEVLKDIRLTILTNSFLKTLVPSNRSQSWSRTELEFANHSRILSKAYNDNVRGMHVNGVGCVTKECTVVSETCGAISIADVEVGEKVLTHKNRYRTVLDTSKRKWSGKIYEVVLQGGVKIKITGEHPFLTLSGKQRYFKRTDKLKEGDSVFIPCSGNNPPVDEVTITNDEAYFYGWYCAEGSATKQGMIRLTVNNDEEEMIVSLMKKVFNKVNVDKHHKWATSVYTCSKRRAGLFRKWFGSNAREKRIPAFIFKSDRQVQANFLTGLFEGDANFNSGWDLCVASETLVKDVLRLSNLLGIPCKRYKDRNNSHSTFGGGDMYRVRVNRIGSKILNEILCATKKKGYLETKIESITLKRSNSHVYNLTVDEDNSYTANLLSLHNCDEMGEYDDHEILKKAVLPTIRAKRGLFVGVGTPKSELDLLHEIESDPGFQSIYFDRYPAEGEKGELFAERYPDTVIEHKDGAVHISDKSTGKLLETYSNMTWSQEFLLKPVSMKDKLFPSSMIQECLDPNEMFQEGVKNLRQYFMGVDFAMSAQSGADYTVITVLEKEPSSKRLKLVWMDRWKGLDYSMQKSRIRELAERYQVTKILGDENSFGRTFIYDLKADGIPIDGYKFTPGSKEEIVKTLRDQFEKKGFIIPFSKNDVKTTMMVKILVDELSKFGIIFDMRSKTVKFEGTGKHDDCHPKGTMIQTITGLKPIDKIKVGEQVLTHLGRYKRVWRTIKKPYKGKLFTIKPYCGLPISVTPEHPIFACSRSNSKWKYKDKSKVKQFWNPKWVLPINFKNTKSRMMFPINRQEILCPYSDDLMWLFGLFAADGSYKDNGTMSISFNSNDTKNVSKSKKIIKNEFGKKCSEYKQKGKNCIVLQWGDIANLHLFHIGKMENRRFPSQFLQYPLAKQNMLYEGYFTGDGYVDPLGNRITATISRELANQVHIILLRLGRCAGIRQIKRKRYTIKNKDQYWVSWKSKRLNNTKSKIYEDYVVSSIQSFKESEINGNVYNLEVEDDESYVAENTIVHNCVISLGLSNFIARHVSMGVFSAVKGSNKGVFLASK